jgi:hypothetical protein
MPHLWISRQALSEKESKQAKDLRFYLPCGVWDYIEEMNFYK